MPFVRETVSPGLCAIAVTVGEVTAWSAEAV